MLPRRFPTGGGPALATKIRSRKAYYYYYYYYYYYVMGPVLAPGLS